MVGDVSFRDVFVITGRFQGKIEGGALLDVKANGNVKASIRVQRIVIGGTSNGNIVASESVEMLAGSNVKGHIITKTLRMEDGATFEGRCEMRDDST